MSRLNHRYVFLDTNVLVHYAAFEIDWLALADAAAVTLVVAPVVIRELDELKETGRYKGIRKRAAKAIRRLSEYHDDGGEIRPATSLALEVVEPSIAFEEHQLNRNIADDNLIASILAFRETQVDADAVLVSAELKFKVKCKHHGIDTIAPPDEKKLPGVSDEHDKRIKELEAENLRLKNRIPKLGVTFTDDSKFRELTLDLQRPISQQEIKRLVLEERQRYPHVKAPDYSATEQEMMMLGMTMFDFKRSEYNTEIDSYLQRYEEFLEELSRYNASELPIAILKLVILNNGTAPANDVDLDLRLDPRGKARFTRKDALPKPPKRPTPPPSFDTFVSSSLSGAFSTNHLYDLYPPHNLYPPHIDLLDKPSTTGPDIEDDGNTALFWVRKLKQHTELLLDDLVVAVNGKQDEQFGFGIEYEIRCDSIPEVQEGRLDLKLTINRSREPAL